MEDIIPVMIPEGQVSPLRVMLGVSGKRFCMGAVKPSRRETEINRS
jgi:hypothetical protein